MCLGVPMQVIESHGLMALCTAGERCETVDMALVGPQALGAWVLVFLGAAREVLDADTAAQIGRALDGLRSLMAGGSLGDAFADLENRSPELPAHLRQAG
jgi:hydrogenase expression/formation protein HypC